MKHYLFILLMIPFLSSCYNVNSYSNYVNNETYSLVKESRLDKEIKTLAEPKTVGCEVFIPLPQTALPELPVDVIKSLKEKTDKEIQTILVSHIKDIREYVRNKKIENTEHYQKYLDRCTRTLK